MAAGAASGLPYIDWGAEGPGTVNVGTLGFL